MDDFELLKLEIRLWLSSQVTNFAGNPMRLPFKKETDSKPKFTRSSFLIITKMFHWDIAYPNSVEHYRRGLHRRSSLCPP